ncbi:MAG: ABC transporter ATP-binding protein [Planctomycetota bacterium]
MILRQHSADIALEERRERVTDDILRGIYLTTAFDGRTVLGGVDIAVRRGDVFVILGPSGCGKTTLLRHLSGMLPPEIGSVFLEGKDLYRLRRRELDELRRRMGFSFQSGALLNSMTVLENVCLPLREATDLPDELIIQVGRMKLDMVGLLHAADMLPAHISGGMKKRAAVARAIALDPDLIFFDEPSAGLDPITSAELDLLILRLNNVFGITMVVVTHEIPSAFAIANHMILLVGGYVIASGTPEEIQASDDPRVMDFINRALEPEEARMADVRNYLLESVK